MGQIQNAQSRMHLDRSRPGAVRGGLSTGAHSGRFPVDASTVQISAFLCSQTLVAPEPAGFRRSDTQFQRVLSGNNSGGS